ncbi:MAG: uroporphyrinogen decarboxylase family protein [Candidatus Coatesbacteria bacterium]
MTPKERMAAVLAGGSVPDAVPIWDLGFYCIDAATGRHLVCGREFEALSPAQRDRALHENAATIALAAEKYDFAAVSVLSDYWEIAPGEPAYYWLPPDARLAQAVLIRNLIGKTRMLVGSSGGVMAMPGAQEFEDFCVRLLEAPDEIEERAKRTLAGGLETVAKLRDAGCDIVYTASDVADNRGPFFRPAQMDRFILPYLRKWAAEVRRMGLWGILHTDGDVHPIMDQLADSGIHALQAIDPVAGMDMKRAMVQARGRIALCGNLDCGLLLRGPADKVYDATASLLDTCKSGGRLILGASNTLFRETPVAHYDAMHRAWRDHGQCY